MKVTEGPNNFGGFGPGLASISIFWSANFQSVTKDTRDFYILNKAMVRSSRSSIEVPVAIWDCVAPAR